MAVDRRPVMFEAQSLGVEGRRHARVKVGNGRLKCAASKIESLSVWSVFYPSSDIIQVLIHLPMQCNAEEGLSCYVSQIHPPNWRDVRRVR